MKFGPVPTQDAEGGVLAHSMRVRDGRLRKGRVLTRGDIDRLLDANIQSVTIARIDATDDPEDTAATRIAAALSSGGIGVRAGPASTGRANLFATGAGVMRIDEAKVSALNSVNPMITLATVPDLKRVEADEMIGTVKIISYAVPAGDTKRAAHIAQGALQLAAPQLATVTLIETMIGTDKPSDKGRRAIQTRAERLGATLSERVVIAHDPEAIQCALAQAPGDLICLLTASATSDAHDVAPSGVVAAGGDIVRFGMPVDPGNLLFIAKLGDRHVLGLPGCARSLALNGADWVFERLICGIEVTTDDIARMGVGGLLKEITTRPSPRLPTED